MKNNKPLIAILITVLIDIIGLGFILPSLPFIVENFNYSESWVGIAFGIFSLGMLVGGFILGRLSDQYGRKNILIISTIMNLIGYIIMAFSPSIYIFMIARFFNGIGSAGWAVGQAYISDISEEKDRTKNLGIIGAMFGIGFILGPVFGSILNTQNLLYLGLIPAVLVFLNVLMVIFVLPDVRKTHPKTEHESLNPLDFHFNKKQIFLLIGVSFITALGFSGLQSTFTLMLNDRFGYGQDAVGYFFGYIGLVSLVYQALIIKYVRKYLDEKGMIIFGLSCLTIGFLLFGINNFAWAILFIITLHPLGMGNIQPSTASSLAKLSKNEVGKVLGTNNSFMSLGNIIGAFLSGYLYEIWSGLPYVSSSLIFAILLVIVVTQLKINNGNSKESNEVENIPVGH